MWIKLFISAFIVCICLPCFSQEPQFEHGEIEWVEKLKVGSLEEQLQLIKQRLLSDTLVYANYSGDLIRSKPDRFSNRVQVPCRPVLLIDNSIINITNDTEGKKIQRLCDLLSTSNIISIGVLRESEAGSLFAWEGKCGVIFIEAKKRKLIKTIKKMGL